jgi:hypothetical protein
MPDAYMGRAKESLLTYLSTLPQNDRWFSISPNQTVQGEHVNAKGLGNPSEVFVSLVK